MIIAGGSFPFMFFPSQHGCSTWSFRRGFFGGCPSTLPPSPSPNSLASEAWGPVSWPGEHFLQPPVDDASSMVVVW